MEPLEEVEKSATDAEFINLNDDETDDVKLQGTIGSVSQQKSNDVVTSTRSRREGKASLDSQIKEENGPTDIETKSDASPNKEGPKKQSELALKANKHSSASSREAAELKAKMAQEPMPTNLEAFKNHPFYVLEKLLKLYEVIHPRKVAGIFKVGLELIYGILSAHAY